MSIRFLSREKPLLPRLLPTAFNRKAQTAVHDGLLWAVATRDPNVADKRATLAKILAAPSWKSAKQVLDAQGVATPEYPALVGQEWLGCGYEPVGTIPCEGSTREPLFELPREFENETWKGLTLSKYKCVEYKGIGHGDFSKSEVSTLQELTRDISASASISGGYSLFGGEMDVHGSSHVERHWEYMFSRILLEHQEYRLRLPGKSQLRQWILPSVRSALAEALVSEPKFHDFLSIYGTYYVNGIIVGGHASIYSEYQKSAYKTQEAMQADLNLTYGAVASKNSVSIASAFSQVSTRSSIFIRSRGGETTPTQATDLAMDSWQADVATHPAWSGFAAGGAPDQSGLVSILELIDDDALRARASVWWDTYVRSISGIKAVGSCVSAINVDGHGESSSRAKSKARSQGRFALLPTDASPVDVNMGAEGWYIYVGMMSQLFDTTFQEAITDIATITGRNAVAPVGFRQIGFDLNKGCGSDSAFIYLCVENGNRSKSPIRQLSVAALDQALVAPVYNGWEVVQDAGGGNADLNKGAGGKFIYMLMDRGMRG